MQTETLLSLDDRKDRIAKRYAMIKDTAGQIHELVAENKKLLQPSSGEGEDTSWHNYVSYIDEMIIDGCFNTVQASLNYFLSETDVSAQPQIMPLFQAKMELQAPDMVFM